MCAREAVPSTVVVPDRVQNVKIFTKFAVCQNSCVIECSIFMIFLPVRLWVLAKVFMPPRVLKISAGERRVFAVLSQQGFMLLPKQFPTLPVSM